ncbi:TRAP transporter small permease [Paracoccus homiensis]|uniref:TRAP transporter small permease protein n=1 Tax=Paracoccus homiensis TaxID=364199 RepID=A0A1I0DA39_9RHOB|nr:TRAP transporter small permease [Paracoccus homiensis]SET28808.1 TRAP-type C4-dicarboxylate transport system, small permease component [Paracoccus homiensis]
MSEDLTEHAHPVLLPGWLAALCRGFAGIGGLVLLAMMLMTVISVTRRTLLGAPIPGDFELVEIGSAIAIFCFLPWCQSTGGNVLVDFFTQRAAPRTNHLLEAVGDLLYLLIAALLMWRMVHGGMEMREYGEQSMVLRIPVWWSFLIIIPAMALLVATCAATMIGHLRKARA